MQGALVEKLHNLTVNLVDFGTMLFDDRAIRLFGHSPILSICRN